MDATRLLQRHVPILGWLPSYDRSALSGDAVAALSVWALLIPQSLAYASLAGVPAQYGLSTAFVALIAYAIFGTSRHLVQGPSAAVCAVSAAAIPRSSAPPRSAPARRSTPPPHSRSPRRSSTSCWGS